MVGGLVVADDLTGANDTGHAFAKRGYTTTVLLEPGTTVSPETEVLVVNTDSRYAPETVASRTVSEVVTNHPADVVYKKIDSTLRGNVVSEVMAAQRALGNGTVPVVSPAAPSVGRCTACGYHLVDGQLVTDSPQGADVEKAPQSAHLPTIFAETGRDVTHISIDRVAAGRNAIMADLPDTGRRSVVVTADAIHSTHLQAIAMATDIELDSPLYVGSSGLANHVKLPDPPQERSFTRDGSSSTATGLGVVGSVAPTTLAGLANVPEDELVVIEPEAILFERDQAIEEAVNALILAIDSNQRAVLTAATTTAAVDRTLEAARAVDIDTSDLRHRVAQSLAITAARVISRRPIGGLFLTGGDTAMTVLTAMDTRSVRLTGKAVESGIPYSRILDGAAAGTRLITKAGGFGDEKTVLRCLTSVSEP